MPKLIDQIEETVKEAKKANLRGKQRDIKKQPYKPILIKKMIKEYIDNIRKKLQEGSGQYVLENQKNIIGKFYKSVAEDFFSETKDNYKIKEKAQQIYDLVAQGKNLKDDIRKIYQELELEIRKVLSKEIVQNDLESFKEIVKRKGQGKIGEKYEEIMSLTQEKLLEQVINYVLNKILSVEVMDKIKQNIYNEKNGSGYSLLHFFCEEGNKEVVQILIDQGWDVKPKTNAGETPSDIASRKAKEVDNKPYEEIIKILELAEKPKKIETRKLNSIQSMMARMKSLGSPIKKYGIRGITQEEKKSTDFSLKTERLMREISSPVAKGGSEVVYTPGETVLYPMWKILVNKDSKVGNEVTIYTEKPRKEEDIETRKNKIQEVAVTLPENSKLDREIIAKTPITKDRLKKWEHEKNEKGRYLSQNQVMGYNSAADVAQSAGFEVGDARGWQWCHLVAFSLGGEDGEIPKGYEYTVKGPQLERNLVVGTAQVNAQMLVIESIVKNLLNNTENGIKELYIKIKPTFVKGLEAYHIAEKLEYTIQDDLHNPKHQVTFGFDMLSRRKTAPQEPDIIGPILEQLFLTGNEEELKKISEELDKEIESQEAEELKEIEEDLSSEQTSNSKEKSEDLPTMTLYYLTLRQKEESTRKESKTDVIKKNDEKDNPTI